MKPIRIAVIGGGEIAQIMHLPFLAELPQFEVTAICDLSETVLEKLGRLYNIPIQTQSYEEALDEVDAVAVLTHEHAPIVEAAAARGKHVFVEKPLSFTLEDCDRILDVVNESGVTLMVGYMKRFDPGYLYAAKRVSALRGVRFIRMHDFGGSFDVHPDVYTLHRGDDVAKELVEASNARISRAMLSALGPGREQLRDVYFEVLMSGIHDLTVLRGMFGQATAVLHSETLAGDGLVSLLDYGGGRTCVFEIALMTEHLWWDQNLSVHAADGIVSIDFPNPFVRYAPSVVTVQENENGAPATTTIPVSSDAAFRREWMHFADCIESGAEPLTNGRDARADVELALAMVQAVQL